MLTKEQISYLFRFCEKHFVYFYEVQVELVDHLANAVEEEMVKDNRLSFESALDIVYSRFGVMGFAPLVSEKSEQLRRLYSKHYWRLVRQQFGWPKILGFLVTGLSFHTVFTRFPKAGLVLLVVIIAGGLGFSFYNQISFSKFLKKSGKRFMSAFTYFQTSSGWMVPYILIQYMIQRANVHTSAIVLSAVVAGYFVSAIVSFQLNKKIKENLVNEYPEVFKNLKTEIS